MKKAFVFLSLVIAMVFIASGSFGQGRGHHYGQYKNHDKHYKGHSNYQHHSNAYRYGHNSRYVAHRRPTPPGWAVHRRYTSMQPVYFPDYYTFYSPQRGGYYYWGGSSWMFSAAMPGFLANVNLGAARMQVMSGIPVTAVPYNYFNHYYAQYPPSASINIHIPLPPRPRR